MKTFSLYQQIILLAVSFFLLIVMIAVFHENGILTIRDFENELVQFKAGNETLKNENEKLHKEIDSLKSDPFAVEILAREKLNLVRPGETVYQLVTEEEKKLPSVE